MLPPTTKMKITTNLKTINNQKCQKIKLHRTPTTKELKKQSTRTTRPLRQVDRENPRQGSRPRRWHWLNGKLRLRADCELWQGLPQWKKLPVSRKHSLESGLEPSRRAALFPLGPSHTDSTAGQQGGLSCPGEYLRPRPLTT